MKVMLRRMMTITMMILIEVSVNDLQMTNKYKQGLHKLLINGEEACLHKQCLVNSLAVPRY